MMRIRRLFLCAWLLTGSASWPHFSSVAAASAAPSALTFNKDIAPILFRNCAPCHRPGQAAPFPLLSYSDAKKHARQIGEVTASRYMPPWLPERGFGEFAHDRSLSAPEIERIQRWIADGASEGAPADLPPPPEWKSEWQLGPPDLVVQVPQPYQLRAEGKDVYRNLVVPIPNGTRRYVKGIEFRPGNYRVVHHAFVNVDTTRYSRHLAEKETPAGFDGMDLPETAQMPGGQLLGWQPGKQPYFSAPGLSWVLDKGTDLVLQLHLHPTGKPESVQPQVGFYFTDQPPTNTAYRIKLEYYKMDLPAGAKDYAVEQSYVLPIDVTLLRILPHAHYLAKEMRVYAVLPNENRQWLMFIKNWDFNWQGEYTCKTPVPLSKGTKLVMNFSYDNSAANVHNPHQPPQRVQYGLESTDEMASCSFQVLPNVPEERKKLAEDFYQHYARVCLDYNEYLLQRRPKDALAHVKAARALLALGDQAKALKHLADALRAKPDFDEAYYDLGAIWLSQDRLVEAKKAFEAAIRFNPNDYKAQGNLGNICLRQGRLEDAELHLRAALRLNPEDEVILKNLEAVARLKKSSARD